MSIFGICFICNGCWSGFCVSQEATAIFKLSHKTSNSGGQKHYVVKFLQWEIEYFKNLAIRYAALNVFQSECVGLGWFR